jgi:hypothetical protein
MNNKKFEGMFGAKRADIVGRGKLHEVKKLGENLVAGSSTDLTGAETRFTPTDKSRRLRVLKIFT